MCLRTAGAARLGLPSGDVAARLYSVAQAPPTPRTFGQTGPTGGAVELSRHDDFCEPGRGAWPLRLAKRRRSVGREAVAPALLIVGRRQTRIKRPNDPFGADCAVFFRLFGAEPWRTPLKGRCGVCTPPWEKRRRSDPASIVPASGSSSYDPRRSSASRTGSGEKNHTCAERTLRTEGFRKRSSPFAPDVSPGLPRSSASTEAPIASVWAGSWEAPGLTRESPGQGALSSMLRPDGGFYFSCPWVLPFPPPGLPWPWLPPWPWPLEFPWP